MWSLTLFRWQGIKMKKSELLKLIEQLGDNASVNEVLSQSDFAKPLLASGLTLDAFKGKLTEDKAFLGDMINEGVKSEIDKGVYVPLGDSGTDGNELLEIKKYMGIQRINYERESDFNGNQFNSACNIISNSIRQPSSSKAYIRMDANAGQVIYNGGKEVKIPKINMDGLGDYSRSGEFTTGAVTLEYETKTMTMDRGRTFMLDAMDINK